MNVVWSRLLRTVYRKEPISGFILTIGAVDAVIGGIDGSWSLVAFGAGAVSVAIALRIWQMQRRTPIAPERVAVHALPPATSRTPLPTLNPSRKKP